MFVIWSVWPKSLQSCPSLHDPIDCSLPGFSVHRILRQEYWSGLPGPSPGVLPDPGIEPASFMPPAWQAGSLLPVSPGKSGEPGNFINNIPLLTVSLGQQGDQSGPS